MPRRAYDTAATRTYNVYVIETTAHGQKTLYVGQSGKTPEARLKDQAARCKRYCPTCKCRHYVHTDRGAHRMRLRYDLFSHYNPVRTRAEAERVERWLARRLTRQGYHVIGGH